MNKLKEEIVARDRDTAAALRECDLSRKEAKNMEDKYTTMLTNVQNQSQELMKKCANLTDRLKIVES